MHTSRKCLNRQTVGSNINFKYAQNLVFDVRKKEDQVARIRVTKGGKVKHTSVVSIIVSWGPIHFGFSFCRRLL